MRYGTPAAALAMVIFALPVAAQQLQRPWASLPYPADSGKPVIFDPQFSANADNDRRLGCAPGSQCRWQLLGVIQNNGAVELRATALTW
jgi:hypothetical protein